jgi:GNAT superfamily N-acetyltransferase
MDTQDLVIRDAAEADADAMGHLHVRAWQSAYRGVMPDEYLDGLQAQDRIAMWRSLLSRSDVPPVLVAVVADEVVGFAVFGAEESPEPAPSCGELYAMNLDPDYWGQGIGRVLFRRVTEALTALGYEEAVLWVVPENERARGLYDSEGWVADGGVSTEEILGVTVTDIRYRKPLAASPPDE